MEYIYSYYDYHRDNDILVSYLEDAIEEKNNYTIYYRNLNDFSNNSFSRKIIEEIANDEEKHKMIFQKILQDIIGGSIHQPKNIKTYMIKSFDEGLTTSIIRKSEAIEKYRKILFLLENKYHKDNLVEILTDEVKHIGLFNMLLTTNSNV